MPPFEWHDTCALKGAVRITNGGLDVSGVIRALLSLADAVENAEGKNDQTEHYRAALSNVAALLQVLPPGHEMAAALAAEHARLRQIEGNTPRVERLRVAYTEIEERLSACFSLSLSQEPRAVDTAENLLTEVVAQIGDPTLMIRRGDVMHMHFIGASVLATYPNGMRLELNLRKAHPDVDGDSYVPGYWIIDGSAWPAHDEMIRRVEIEESIGATLPRGIESRAKAQLRTLIAACASSVVSLVPRPQAPAEATFLARLRG